MREEREALAVSRVTRFQDSGNAQLGATGNAWLPGSHGPAARGLGGWAAARIGPADGDVRSSLRIRRAFTSCREVSEWSAQAPHVISCGSCARV